MAVTPDGRFAVSASEDITLKVWYAGTWRAARTLEVEWHTEGPTEAVNDVAVTPDGCFAVSASDDWRLYVWELGTGQAIRILKGHTETVTSVAVTPDGRFAVSASGDKTLKVWDLATGQPITTLESHAPLWCCAITPDGKTILAGDSLGALHILDWRNPPLPRSAIKPQECDRATGRR